MSNHIRWSSIDQFKQLVKAITSQTRYLGKDAAGEAQYDPTAKLPTLTLTGTVKLHGTNAGIRVSKDGQVTYQSRERDLSLEQDNAGFMLWASQYEPDWIDIAQQYFINQEMPNADLVAVVLFGEWCGGNIQKGVALSQLDKMYVLFGAKGVNSSGDSVHFSPPTLASTSNSHAKNIYEFPTYEVICDFENPHIAANEIASLVEQVEAECPVGKALGVSGIGEGLVFTCEYKGETLMFKAKGDKHANSKVKVHRMLDTTKIESINDFVDTFVTEPRLVQGLSYMDEMCIPKTKQNVGDFIRWVVGDVIKEHQQEMIDNQLDTKAVSPNIAKVARTWYFVQEEVC